MYSWLGVFEPPELAGFGRGISNETTYIPFVSETLAYRGRRGGCIVFYSGSPPRPSRMNLRLVTLASLIVESCRCPSSSRRLSHRDHRSHGRSRRCLAHFVRHPSPSFSQTATRDSFLPQSLARTRLNSRDAARFRFRYAAPTRCAASSVAIAVRPAFKIISAAGALGCLDYAAPSTASCAGPML